MKRNLSLEDLFANSEEETDQTLELSPQRSTSSINAVDVVIIDSDSEQLSFSSVEQKSSAQLVNVINNCSEQELLAQSSLTNQSRVIEISDGEDSVNCNKTERMKRTRQAEKLLINSKPIEKKPACQYGKQCYRKNPVHFEEYDHPEGSINMPNSSPPVKKQRVNSESGSSLSHSSTSCAKKSLTSNIDQSQPFSFFLTKVNGINKKFNSALSLDIRDLLSTDMGRLQKSVQFNYCIDIPWLISQYPAEFQNQPLLIVHGAKGREQTSLQEAASQFSNIRLCQAPLDIAYGTHHTKMMLLLYDTGLRIVIHTANLISGDWYQKTQGIWVSPLFSKLALQTGGNSGDSPSCFKRDLLEYLKAYRQRSLDEWITTLIQFDMSSANVVLIGSVPGRHTGEMKNHFGHLKLRKELQKSGPDGKLVSSWSVIGQFSSVGSLGTSSDSWLTSEWLSSLSSHKGSASDKVKLQLVFPSKDNVRCSLEGYPAGASIPYSIHTARRQLYFNSFLHQWKANRRGRSRASPHIKTYTRASPDGTCIGWFLLTSANLSKAAWGSTEKNGTQLFIRSYELGVLFLPQHFGLDSFLVTNISSEEQREEHLPTGNSFPFPFDLPPTPYAKDDKPWIWDIPYTDKPDSNGNIWSPS